MKPHFSELPGCRERHLQRRCDNPLFPAQVRKVTQAQVDEARQRDQAEVARFADEFQGLLQRASVFSGRVDTEEVLQLKEDIDRLYEQCVGLAGDHSGEKRALLKLNDVIMASIRTAAAGDGLAAEELERETAARDMHLRLLDYPLVVDLLRSDTPVEREDLVPALLSADAETVPVVMSLFDAEQQAALRAEARALVQALERRGQASRQLLERLTAMEASPQ
jgi:hypothetical protein